MLSQFSLLSLENYFDMKTTLICENSTLKFVGEISNNSPNKLLETNTHETL